MVAKIEADVASRREQLGIEQGGVDRIRNQDLLSRPVKDKRSPKPLCHSAPMWVGSFLRRIVGAVEFRE